MGFDIVQVLSDDKHYSPFVCGFCQNLVTLDALIATKCSHPFCKGCFEDYMQNEYIPKSNQQNGENTHGVNGQQQQQQQHSPCECPVCRNDMLLSSTTNGGNHMVGGGMSIVMDGTKVRVAVQPLQQAQPLAYRLLANVQVACIDRSDRVHCEWSGDYIDFLQHATVEHGSECATKSFKQPTNTSTASKATTKKPLHVQNMSTPSLNDQSSSEDLNNIGTVGGVQFEFEDDDILPMDRNLNNSQGSGMGSAMGITDHRDRFGEKSPLDEMNRSLASIAAAGGIGPNESIASPPLHSRNKESINDATTSTAASTLAASHRGGHADAPPPHVQRTVSEDGSLAGVDVRFGGTKSLGGAARPARKGKKPSPGLHSSLHDDKHQDDNLDVSYSHALDWNTSISSFGGRENSYREAERMETLAEQGEFELEFEPEGGESVHHKVEKTKKTREKAEKLKKQANAKFNKGDFAAARNLYTDGINTMSTVTIVTADERDLLSNMHSNRAVTYFREKKFEECIADCDKAIKYDPTYDKSWIRKWRALMALGSFDRAYDCLQTAAQTVPDSKKIQEELSKCSGDKQIIDGARELLEKGDYRGARDMLKPYTRNSDNLGILLLAAKADAGLGHTESALEKVNRTLRFNPGNTEGLEVRGYILFLTGETEKGAHLLQEAYGRNRENRSTRLELMRCQKTHSALSQGRACVKRGRYIEALEHFSNAIKESGSVPPQAPLFGQLRTERAEAFLLSKKYMQALNDCDDVLAAQQENATAWSVRAEILISLGKADEAKRELERIRNTWGADNPTIDEGYRRVDFELRVLKEDEELMKFVANLQSGNVDELPFEVEKDQRQKSTSRKLTGRRGKSSGDYDADDFVSPRADKDSKKPGKSGKDRTDASRRRSSGEQRADRHRSKSRPRDKQRDHEKERVERSKSNKGSFVPPPSIDDLRNGFHDSVTMPNQHGAAEAAAAAAAAAAIKAGKSGKENKRKPNFERQGTDARPRRSQSVKRN